jgi:hypothetical protein
MNHALSIPALVPAFVLGAGDLAPTSSQWAPYLEAPGVAAALAFAAVGVGVLLWLLGARLIRPVGAIVGAVLGIALGSGLIAGILSDRFEFSGAPIISILLGGLIGAALGLVAYRVICAGLTGLSVAALVLLGTLCATPGPTDTTSRRADNTQFAHAGFSLVGFWNSDPAPRSTPNQRDIERRYADSSGAALNHSILRNIVPASGLRRWDALEPSQRTSMSLVAVVAGLLAAFAGLVAPQRASAFSASILGSGLALAGVAWLTQRTALDAGLSPMPWLLAWGVLALLGLAVQVGGRATPQPRPA